MLSKVFLLDWCGLGGWSSLTSSLAEVMFVSFLCVLFSWLDSDTWLWLSCHVFFFFFLTVQSWFGSLVGVLAVSCSLSWGHEVWENVCSNCWANIQSVKNGKLFSAKILIYWINQLLKSDLPTWGQRQKLFLKSTNSWAQQSWFCWNMWAKNKCSSFELRWKT